jgi:hypothetical protein
MILHKIREIPLLFRTRRRMVVAGLCALAVAGYAYRAYSERRIIQNLAKVEKDLTNISHAFGGWSIDIKTVLYPGEGNNLPLELLGNGIESPDSPSWATIAYIKAYPNDPFAPKGERANPGYRFIPQIDENGYAPRIILVSRGPDGDWDIDNLPLSHEIYRYMNVPKDALKALEFPDKEEKPRDKIWRSEFRCAYFINRDGEKILGSTYSIKIIPNTKNDLKNPRNNSLSDAEIFMYLRDNNVVAYDPSNGLVSNGDIFKYY